MSKLKRITDKVGELCLFFQIVTYTSNSLSDRLGPNWTLENLAELQKLWCVVEAVQWCAVSRERKWWTILHWLAPLIWEVGVNRNFLKSKINMYFTSKIFEWINSTYRHIGHLSCHWHLSHLEFKWLGDGCMPANTIWQFEGHIGGFQHRLQCRGHSLGSKSHQTKPYGFVKQLTDSRVAVSPSQRMILWTVICLCFFCFFF